MFKIVFARDDQYEIKERYEKIGKKWLCARWLQCAEAWKIAEAIVEAFPELDGVIIGHSPTSFMIVHYSYGKDETGADMVDQFVSLLRGDVYGTE